MPKYGCSPVNLLCIFRTLFYKSTSEGILLLYVALDLDVTLTFQCYF